MRKYYLTILDELARTEIKYIILRLRRVRNPDAVATEYLEHFLHDAEKQGITVLLAGLRPDFVKILDNVELTNGSIKTTYSRKRSRFSPPHSGAVRYAYKLIHEKAAKEGTTTTAPALHEDKEPSLLSRLAGRTAHEAD